MSSKLFLLLFAGLAIHLLLIPQPGFEADIAYWKSWSLAASEKGIVWLTYNTNYNYPSGFALVLWLIGKIYRLFADPNNFNQYWQTNNYLFLLLCKLPSIFADLAIAWGIYHLISRPKILKISKAASKLAYVLAAIYLFHPAVLFDGAWWGQVDSIGVAFVLFSLIFLCRGKPILASIFITAGFLLKLQTMIFLPLFFLYVWRVSSWQGLTKSLMAAVTTFLIIAFPFSFSGNLERTVYLITQNADWFPLLSLRAYNLWWLASWGKGMEISDKILVLGPLNAKMLGLILFSLSYLIASLLTFLKPSLKNLLFSFVLAGFAFFMFPTQSHDRYIFPALILSLLFLPIFWQKKHERWLVLLFFIILSLNSLFNLNLSMIAEYPENGIPVLSWLKAPFFSILISASNLILFLIYLWWILRVLGGSTSLEVEPPRNET